VIPVKSSEKDNMRLRDRDSFSEEKEAIAVITGWRLRVRRSVTSHTQSFIWRRADRQ
jgi:hypothetical protein